VVKTVEKVYNPQVVQDFNSFHNKIKNRQKENPVLFKSRAWTLAEDAEMKENVFQRYEKLAAGPLSPLPSSSLSPLPLPSPFFLFAFSHNPQDSIGTK
jgi:hypothetical protein